MVAMRISLEMRLTDREIVKIIYRSKEPVSQASIAGLLGCSERTVLRSIKRIKSAGYITMSGGGGCLPHIYNVNIETLPDDIRSELE